MIRSTRSFRDFAFPCDENISSPAGDMHFSISFPRIRIALVFDWGGTPLQSYLFQTSLMNNVALL